MKTKPDTRTHEEKVLSYLRSHGTIDQYTAGTHFRIFNLAKAIQNLRQAGHPSKPSPNTFPATP